MSATGKSKLADAVASLLSMPAVRHLLSVIVSLLAGYLLLRFGSFMPAAPLATAPSEAVDATPAAPPVAVAVEPEAAAPEPGVLIDPATADGEADDVSREPPPEGEPAVP